MDSKRRFLIKALAYSSVIAPAATAIAGSEVLKLTGSEQNKRKFDRLDDDMITIDGWILVNSDLLD